MYKKEIGHGGEADVYEYEGEKSTQSIQKQKLILIPK